MMQRIRETSPTVLAVTASAALALAAIGGAIFEPLWLVLTPATVLIFLAVGAFHARWEGRYGHLGRMGATALRVGCMGLLATAIAGYVVIAVRGVEPAWLSTAAIVSGVAFLVGELVFGLAAGWRRVAPRGAAFLFATAIPLGLAVGKLPDLLFPIPGVFGGLGVYAGLGLLALSLARLGRAMGPPSDLWRPMPRSGSAT